MLRTVFCLLSSLALATTAVAADSARVPLDIGVGPAVHLLGPAVGDSPPLHPGVVLSIQAVLDRATLRRLGDRVPARYRSAINGVDEVRLSPLWFLPDTVVISPGLGSTSVYGASWRPIAVGLPLARTPVFRVHADVGARLTTLYLRTPHVVRAGEETGSQQVGDIVGSDTTVFVRIGGDARLEVEAKISDGFLISLGWTSMVHVPQKVGGAPWTFGGPGERLWHIGQAALKLHVRVPVPAGR